MESLIVGRKWWSAAFFFSDGEVWRMELVRYLLQVVAGTSYSFVGCWRWIRYLVSALDVLLFAHGLLVPRNLFVWSIQMRADVIMP